ncbi:MAG: hypothetical protein IPH53_03515 [Flavobacteriales bacterium]|nr:hypothetical protein [Flavobacteriales bacterium]
MTLIIRTVLFFGSLLPFALLAQQVGENDTTFNVGDVGFGEGLGPNGKVTAVVLQPDGKAIIGGSFTRYNSRACNGIARLNPDGSLDSTFTTGTAFGSNPVPVVETLALQPDGKILAGGNFLYYAALPAPRIIRLNVDGSRDTTFSTGTGFDDVVHELAVQPDGRILAAGAFAMYNGTPRSFAARLDTDGSLDPSFDPGALFTDVALCVLVQPDGKVLVGGEFYLNGRHLVRLESNGVPDPLFTGPSFSNGWVSDVALQSDGRTVVTGSFQSAFPTIRSIMRLEADGARDTSFHTGLGLGVYGLANGSSAERVLIQADGKILLVGAFTAYDEQYNGHMIRLNADGTPDPSLQLGGGFSNDLHGCAIQADGSYIVVGEHGAVDGVGLSYLTRISSNGVADITYPIQTGVNDKILALLVQADGRIVLGGECEFVNGERRRGLARLLSNGDLDTSFHSGAGATGLGSVRDIEEQSDGRLLICGGFSHYYGYPFARIARVNTDGTADMTFNPGASFNNEVRAMVLQPDGKIIVCGSFTSYNGVVVNRLARLNPDATLDPSFDPGTGADNSVFAIARRPDGSLLIAGLFTSVDGTPMNRIARLHADGSLDTTFDPGGGFNDIVFDLALQPDGRILACGWFTDYAGTSRKRIARLQEDGTLDTTFDPGFGFGGLPAEPIRMMLQPDGKVIVGGAFYTFNGHAHSAILRLLADGSNDPDWVGNGFVLYGTANNPPSVHALALQGDGKVLAGGIFFSYNGAGRNCIARIHGSPVVGLSVAPRVMLGGAYDSGTQTMNDMLRAAALLPLLEPYTSLGYPHSGGGGGEMVAPALMDSTGNNAIVDWVIVELRSANDPATVLASRSALVQRDGDVVAVDGSSSVPFQLPLGDYHVAIRHRNHLGVMTAAPFALSALPTMIDLIDPAMITYGTNARKEVNGAMVLWPGNANPDGIVKYAGANNDRDAVLQVIGGSPPTNTLLNVYDTADINLDGAVKYMGSDNDRDIILQTIGGSVPTATRTQQLP